MWFTFSATERQRKQTDFDPIVIVRCTDINPGPNVSAIGQQLRQTDSWYL